MSLASIKMKEMFAKSIGAVNSIEEIIECRSRYIDRDTNITNLSFI